MKKNNQILISALLVLVTAFFLIPAIALGDDGPITIDNPLKNNPLFTGSEAENYDWTKVPEKLINRIITITLGLAGSLAVVFIVYGGILMITSGGNKEKFSKGMKALQYALIGLALVFLSYVIVYLVSSLVLKL